MFAVRAVAPENVFRLGQQFDLVHPIQDRPVLRLAVANSFWRRNSGCEVFHESRSRSCRTWSCGIERVTNFIWFAPYSKKFLRLGERLLARANGRLFTDGMFG